MTSSSLQRQLFELQLAPSWLDILHQLPIDLLDYSDFLNQYSTDVLASQIEATDAEDIETSTLISMSNQQATFSSKSFVSSSFTTSHGGEAPQTWKSSESTSSNPEGTTIHRTTQQPGQAATEETLRLDDSGKVIKEPNSTGMIEDVSETDKEYMERMEDEYAKREGGA